jgi:uncharacterized membrane protein YesL
MTAMPFRLFSEKEFAVMRGLFSPDNPVIRFLAKLGYIWILNFLWLVTSLPIFTIGASTTALIYSCMKLHGEEGYLVKNYFHSFRENFRQATMIWLIYAGIGALLVLDLWFWKRQGGSGAKLVWAGSIAVGIFYVISLLYVFAIQSKFVNSVKDTIHFSLILPYRHWKETILMLVVIAAVVWLNVNTIFLVNFLTINFGIAGIAYLFSVYYINIFRRYIPEEE